jgi:hypothetical protein
MLIPFAWANFLLAQELRRFGRQTHGLEDPGGRPAVCTAMQRIGDL